MPKVEQNYRSQRYRKVWENENWALGWLCPGKQVGKAHCNVCDKDLVAGKSELIGHTKTSSHIRPSKQIQSNCRMTSFVESKDESRIKAELNVVAMIVRKNLSFNCLDDIVNTLHFVADDSKAIKSMTCNRTKGTYLLNECLSPYAHEKLMEEVAVSGGISILCDKATYITMNKTFCVNLRFLKSNTFEPVTRFYRLIPVSDGSAQGLFELLKETLVKDGIGWDQVVGYASDGENVMQGERNSLLTKLKDAVPDLFVMKCFCHTFHLVAGHACGALSKTAEEIIHDTYNYFKLSPNRQKSYEEFQHFANCKPHKLLKPCQTRWLSISQCVDRILSQWPALELYFTEEAFGMKNLQSDRILQALKSPYIKATLEFSSFVLGDFAGLNKNFHSNSFQLHLLLPETERVLRMFASNFMKRELIKYKISAFEDPSNWLQLDQVYPGILANETLKKMKPHEKDSFLSRCRDWYKIACSQILKRIDLLDPVFLAMKDVNHQLILKDKAIVSSAAVLFHKLPRLLPDVDVQSIDRQWRSILVDEEVKKGAWENHSVVEFWNPMRAVPSYKEVSTFMLKIMALPQSTAEVERTFSKLNNNKTKLRNKLSVSTLESIIKTSERFQSSFAMTPSLVKLYSGARTRRIPDRKVFYHVLQNLRDKRCFPRILATAEHHERGDQRIIIMVEHSPRIIIRRISSRLGVPRTRVWQTLKHEGLHPFHLQYVQHLQPGDAARRLEFSTWLQDHPQLCKYVLYTDEAIFTRCGYRNTRNDHYWLKEIPKKTAESHFQHRFSVNVWCGIVGDQLIGPHIFEGRLTGKVYLKYLGDKFLCLLEDVPLKTSQRIIFQHDWALAHYTKRVNEYLHQEFPGRWIGRGGPYPWPARSPDLTPLDFHHWGYMKSLVYKKKVNSREELLQEIKETARVIKTIQQF
ncbi:hypothetical protein Pmani_009961 [Petrolisthes manimaculis]|uniref:HAT C-terminal dimerisation domain-containing protein n=1 Tax=Petrolisthes manimaculis TaxID=1843537 RepID=A0AAE1UD47_9EUCA|nr:hypothetical protein Pmani_009961 [Petrolisthes manimaculis]